MTFTFANVNGKSALISDGSFFDLEVISDGAVSADPMEALAEPETLHTLSSDLESFAASGMVDDVVLGAPVPRPANSFGIGLNYQTHVDEAAMDTPEVPMVFAKLPSCITGPTSDVQMRSGECDYEGELVVVIGSGGKDIREDRAWEHVVGLTVGEDFSDRGAQFMSTPAQFTLGKSMDSFGPTGPVLVSTDSFTDPADLELRTWVNEELRQHDRTSSMIFSIPELISFISRHVTLSTGDLIFTGTPEGVGFRNGVFLIDGDVVRTSIEGIGTLENRCISVPD
ncbi:MAG: fumarylacetoacetate hydrolase family protein [Acidimicrobiales bacterium]|nr:fumarylacetoacetate hydrolase family protein [Acidimicrobiales bacterium]